MRIRLRKLFGDIRGKISKGSKKLIIQFNIEYLAETQKLEHKGLPQPSGHKAFEFYCQEAGRILWREYLKSMLTQSLVLKI